MGRSTQKGGLTSSQLDEKSAGYYNFNGAKGGTAKKLPNIRKYNKSDIDSRGALVA
jgi:hypothetical protein